MSNLLLFVLELYCGLCAADEWWSNWSPPAQAAPLNITVCTQVTYGTGYMFEWIEYHALLGVSKFVIYDAGLLLLFGSFVRKKKKNRSRFLKIFR